MSNRVEELESKVAELQAAVNGLTEELVETKERVRLLEEEVEVDLATGNRPVGHEPADDATASAATSEESTSSSQPTEASEPESTATGPLSESEAQKKSRRETSAQTADDADFIDADAADPIPSEAEGTAEPSGDGDKADDADEEDEAATEDDDIIVA
ncbi:DUF7518 family protein [Halobellus clavatus]|jgi:hypothetical protein|uniref:Chromosome segregation protein SMC n=1 Tax=Halobellus clavatus TaxID=660517 RepID=A0A1H3D375_9EURY|nr:hypothetical protein [Halobellus clavatus]SDX60847.1 hypothetical protein SAMN04487946_101339 [Halobellus clavatus]